MRRAAFALLLPLAACMTPHAPSFPAELAAARFEVPKKPEISPAPATAPEDPMARSVAEAEAYLARRPKDAQARALLVCARLIRGEIELARAAAAGWRERPELSTSRNVNLMEAASHAVNACRAVEARRALGEVVAKRLDPARYLELYGDLVGAPAPEEFRAICLPEIEGDPRSMEQASSGRRIFRQRLAEQVYNDTAEIVSHLHWIRLGKREGADAYLARLAVGLLSVWARMMPDLLATKLSEDQKQWLREQFRGIFDRLSGFLDDMPELREPLEDAKGVVFAWIGTR